MTHVGCIRDINSDMSWFVMDELGSAVNHRFLRIATQFFIAAVILVQ